MGAVRFKNAVWLIVSLLIVLLDQWTKVLIDGYLYLGEAIPYTSFFNLVNAHNYGAAFSFLSDQSGWQRWLFTGISSVVSLFLIAWILTLKESEKRLALSLAFILGGAVGNLYDRIDLGYVIDFLDFYYLSYHFPAFNVADSFISIGAAILILDTFLTPEIDQETTAP